MWGLNTGDISKGIGKVLEIYRMFFKKGFAMKMKVIRISFAELLLHINRLINSFVDT